MCGIAGFVGRGDRRIIEAMTDAIRHRGPDDAGVAYVEGPANVGLGNTRLAIQDLSPDGHQPMSTPDARYTIVFNGEIYNFKELRAELIRDGFQPRSGSDTEVLLALFRNEGRAMLSRLNGMWAFAIWDAEERSLFLARDRFGEKPLYLFQQGSTLLFGSELKSFAHHPSFTVEVDHTALLRYLTFLWVPEPDSLFAGVHKLPPGHFATYKNGSLEIAQYWDLPLHVERPVSAREAATEVRTRLFKSVERRLVSDRPVGAFLSGGIDSSTMVAAMAAVSTEPVQTYTIGFRNTDFEWESVESEVPLAQRVAKHVGAKWEHIELGSEISTLLPTVIEHLDEPVADPAAITAFLLCQAAKKERTVLLSGMGGDEVFAGYRRHKALQMTELYRRTPALLRGAIQRRLVPALEKSQHRKILGLAKDARTFLSNVDAPFEERFIGYARYHTSSELSELLHPDLRARVAVSDVTATHARVMARSTGADPLLRMLYTDMKTFMPSLNMLYMDKMSMASAVEVRLPFLDHELVKYAASLSSSLKIRRMTGKWILRKAFDGMLPSDVLWSRKKVGFGAPIRTWLKRDLAPLLNDVLSDRRVRERGLFDPARVRAIVNNPLQGRNDLRIWSLLTLEIWLSGIETRTRAHAMCASEASA